MFSKKTFLSAGNSPGGCYLPGHLVLPEERRAGSLIGLTSVKTIASETPVGNGSPMVFSGSLREKIDGDAIPGNVIPGNAIPSNAWKEDEPQQAPSKKHGKN